MVGADAKIASVLSPYLHRILLASCVGRKAQAYTSVIYLCWLQFSKCGAMGGLKAVWQHVEKVDPNDRGPNFHLRCKWCPEMFKGTASRAREHLAGDSHNIAACPKVPDAIKQAMRKLGKGGKETQQNHTDPVQPQAAADLLPAARGWAPNPTAEQLDREARKPQTTIKDWIATNGRGAADLATAEMVYELGLPLRFGTKPAFREFVGAVQAAPADWELPSLHAVRGPHMATNTHAYMTCRTATPMASLLHFPVLHCNAHVC